MKTKILPLLLLTLFFFQCSKDDDDKVDPNPTPTEIVTKTLTTDTKLGLRSIHFINEQTGYIAGGNTGYTEAEAIILKTTDSGNTLEEVYSTKGYYITKITSNVNGTLFASTNGKYVLRSKDEGKTWEEVSVQDNNFYMSDIQFTDANNGYIVGSNSIHGTIMKTTDGGNTWTEAITDEELQKQFLDSNPLRAITSDNNTLLVSGGRFDNGTILRSTDNGTNWEIVTVSTEVTISDVLIKDGSYLAVGNNGRVSDTEKGIMFQSTDKGKTWQTVTTGYENVFYSLDKNSKSMCIAGGNAYNDLENPELILLSFDEGQNWQRLQHPFVVAAWEDICFVTKDKILVVGLSGRAMLIEMN